MLSVNGKTGKEPYIQIERSQTWKQVEPRLRTALQIMVEIAVNGISIHYVAEIHVKACIIEKVEIPLELCRQKKLVIIRTVLEFLIHFKCLIELY